MMLSIGQARLRGDFQRYAARFDFLEVRATPGKLPRQIRLTEYSEAAPQGFQFCVVVDDVVGALEGRAGAEQALTLALKSADSLKASWFLVQTPVGVTPSRRSRERLQGLTARLRATGRRVAWEPRGLWEPEVAAEEAAAQGVVLVQDLSRVASVAQPSRYVRLRAVGAGARVSLGALERLVVQLEGAEAAIVVMEGEGAARAALELRGLITDETEATLSSSPRRVTGPRGAAASSGEGEDPDDEDFDDDLDAPGHDDDLDEDEDEDFDDEDEDFDDDADEDDFDDEDADDDEGSDQA